MKSHFSIFAAILRKDLRLFWPFAVLNAALIVVWQFPSVMGHLEVVGTLMQLVIPLAIILLTLVVFHEDAITSVKHDWLTRPIPGISLLLAKCTFIILAIFIPTILGHFANSLYEGRSLSESLLMSVSAGAGAEMLILNLIVMALAVLTASIRQVIIVMVAGTAVLALLATLLDMSGVGEIVNVSGSGSWAIGPLKFLTGAVLVTVLWVQYCSRHTKAAYVIVGTAVMGGTAFFALMSLPHIFGLQRFLSPDPAAESSVQVELASGCFPARILDESKADQRNMFADNTAITPEQYRKEQWQQVGSPAIAFSTQLIRKNIQAEHRLTIRRAHISYRNARDEVVSLHPGRMPQRTTTDAGLSATHHYWLLSPSDYERLVKDNDVKTQVDYSLSLLAPQATAEFAADGRRAFYPGIGYCSAAFDRATQAVKVDCFKAGVQPAQLVANLGGAPEAEARASRGPDYTPAMLDFWGGRQHIIQLRIKGGDVRGSNVPRVKVTAFAGRAHFDRQIVVPGVLGGPVSVCPAPVAK